MKFYAKPSLRVEKDVVTYVTRTLKGSGQLNVKVGQVLSPEEIIGTGTISPGFRILNLSQLLAVPPQEVEKYLSRNLNQRIYKGELLAFKKGWLLERKKIVTSPTDGVLDYINKKTGELKITFMPKKVHLLSGMYGIVEAVDSEKCQVVIKTQVSRIHGLFGSGRSREGILRILNKKDNMTTINQIQTEYSEHILAGNTFFLKEAISQAISYGVNGIITGGINAKDYKAICGERLVFPKKIDSDIGISIIVCEGFGLVPVGLDIFSTLVEYEGKFIFMDGNKAVVSLPSPSSSSLTKVKNTRLPQVKEDDLNLKETALSGPQELKIGLKVRIIGNSYLGEQGKLLAINETPTLLSSGITAHLATVETARRKIQVPVANIEIIG